MADYEQISTNVMQATNPHQAFLDRLPDKAKILITMLEELYFGSWEQLIEDVSAQLEGRPHVFGLFPEEGSTPDALQDTLNLAIMLQKYEQVNAVIFIGEGDPHVPNKVPLDRVPGRNDYRIEDMRTVFESGVIKPLEEKLDPYSVILRPVKPLDIPSSTLEFTPEFMLAVLGHSNQLFPKNAEKAPYEGRTIPIHWLTNGQCEEALWRYLAEKHESAARALFDGLVNDIDTNDYNPGIRSAATTEEQFFSRFKKIKAKGLAKTTLGDIIAVDRYAYNQQVSYPIRAAAYRFMIAMQKHGLVQRMGHHELASKTWALPGYEKLHELQG